MRILILGLSAAGKTSILRIYNVHRDHHHYDIIIRYNNIIPACRELPMSIALYVLCIMCAWWQYSETYLCNAACMVYPTKGVSSCRSQVRYSYTLDPRQTLKVYMEHLARLV
jgi:pectate lyase